jgi:hypothetical protein
MSNNDSHQIANKAWNFAHFLRDDGLRRSTLKRAFENKLVLQYLKDEFASVLLERLRVTRLVIERNGNAPTSTRSSRRLRSHSAAKVFGVGANR